MRAFLHYIRDIANADAEDQRNNVRSARMLPDEAERRLNAIDRWSWAWSPKSARIGIAAINPEIESDDGRFIGSEGADHLRDHWASAFCANPLRPDEINQLLRQAQVCPSDIRWKLERSEFDNVIDARSKDTAVGPAGIPYSAYRLASDDVRDRLWLVYSALCDGAQSPLGFNHASIVFLLKTAAVPGEVPSRRPSQLRILSLSNADQKIDSSAFCVPFARVASVTCHEAQ